MDSEVDVDILGNTANTPSTEQSMTSTMVGEKKKRMNTSDAWKHFKRVDTQGQNARTECMHCGKRYMSDPVKHGTGNMLKHLRSCPVLNPPEGAMDNYVLSYDDEGAKNQLKQHKLDKKVIREKLVEWIVCDELPFTVVQSQKFRGLIASLEPRFDVPSRVTIARDLFKLYKANKEKLKEELRTSVGRINLTTDMWTSVNNTSYMCVTAHFIDKGWQLHKRIISFTMVEDHTGNGIGKQLENVTKEWGISKLMCITVDNASANDGAVEWIRSYGSNLILGGNYLHVRCFAHILNLIVKHGLNVCNESVVEIRNAVKYVRSSPKRQSKFEECAAKVGVSCTKSLCLDVPTRWNSTLLMLEVAIEYQRAFDRLRDKISGTGKKSLLFYLFYFIEFAQHKFLLF
ncbi:hypothetical protein Dimus_038124 [Dionaea muscipula]